MYRLFVWLRALAFPSVVRLPTTDNSTRHSQDFFIFLWFCWCCFRLLSFGFHLSWGMSSEGHCLFSISADGLSWCHYLKKSSQNSFVGGHDCLWNIHIFNLLFEVQGIGGEPWLRTISIGRKRPSSPPCSMVRAQILFGVKNRRYTHTTNPNKS